MNLAHSLVCAVIIVIAPSSALPQSSTFKVETNLVLVPVIVRDAKGNPVGNLQQEDFQLFDKGRPQEITKFTVEETSGQVAEDRSLPGNDQPAAAAPMAIRGHFVAMLFDDIHMRSGPGDIGDYADVIYSRQAALKFLETLQPADRMAVYTTSGRIMVDFTSDRARLKDELSRLAPVPTPSVVESACGLAHDIERDSRVVVTMTADIVRRMERLPGQRTLVLITSGLQLYQIGMCGWSLVPETMQIIDHALKSRVVINGLDARGLALSSNLPYRQFQEQIAYGTGGRFITDNNDLKGSIERLGATPKSIYVLGFSPRDLKPDGKFHSLTVKLSNGHSFDVQARKGYWAPDANELARRQNGPAAVERADTPHVDEAQTKSIAEAMGAVAPAEASIVTASAAPQPEEISTHDEPVTFKAQSNLVEVPVVVRDRQGHAVGSLVKDDFRIFDKGKRQEITKFAVEKAATTATPEAHARNLPAPDGVPGAATEAVPGRFTAFVFDDLHLQFDDLPQVREAVRRHLKTSWQAEDRAAVYATSGKIAVDFTANSEALDGALLKIVPSPITASALRSCFYVSYYQAVMVDQQVGLRPQYPDDLAKSAALNAAYFDAGQCLPMPDPKTVFETAVMELNDALINGKTESRAVLIALTNLVRRMAVMPGQRRIILVSPGFFVSPELQDQGSALLALAIRSRVLINTIDARGVWTNQVFSASRSGAAPPPSVTTFKDLDGTAADDELIALAEGTGGTANLNNDFAGGVRKAAATPEYLYVLGFAPQNLKMDGAFHSLKVAVDSQQHLSLQARRGYWAPQHADDAGAVARQEIENAVFSRDEIHSLPVEMHTQVLGAGSQAKLNVLTSVDLKLIHLRKADDRNRNDLTIVAALFDANGNFIAGAQKILQLRLRDATVEALAQKLPVTISTKFDMKPGAYLVRLVVRDTEGQQVTAENAGVRIPDATGER